MAGTSRFVDALFREFEYAFTTIYDDGDGSVICEGTVRMLAKVLDFGALDIRSFYVAELEDGSVQADIRIGTNGNGGGK